MTIGDIGFLFEEIWKGRSCLTGSDAKLQLVKWDNKGEFELGNMICVGRKEAQKHSSVKIENVVDVYGDSVVKYVNERLEVERVMNISRQTDLDIL